jgi:hypothetical protein
VAWLLPEITQRIASQTRILSGYRKFHSADQASPMKSLAIFRYIEDIHFMLQDLLPIKDFISNFNP